MPLWIHTSGCAIDSHQLIAAAILRCRGDSLKKLMLAGLVAVLGFAPAFALAQAQAEEKILVGQVQSVDESGTRLTLKDGTTLLTPPGANAPTRNAPRRHARGSDVPAAGKWGQGADQTLLGEERASSSDTERIAETVPIASPDNQRRARIVARMMRSAPAMLRGIRLEADCQFSDARRRRSASASAGVIHRSNVTPHGHATVQVAVPAGSVASTVRGLRLRDASSGSTTQGAGPWRPRGNAELDGSLRHDL